MSLLSMNDTKKKQMLSREAVKQTSQVVGSVTATDGAGVFDASTVMSCCGHFNEIFNVIFLSWWCVFYIKRCRHIDQSDDYQFGFKKKHSTALCTAVFKRTVKYYTERGSHVFCAFIDFNKAFDNVDYWLLFL